jgi:hypothetical protein
MTKSKTDRASTEKPATPPKREHVPAEPKPRQPPQKVEEIGGRDGPDPTRYGDYEKDGRCIDF